MSRFVLLSFVALPVLVLLSAGLGSSALADTSTPTFSPGPTPSPSPPPPSRATNFHGVACIDANCEGAAHIVTASINGVECASAQVPVVVDGQVNQTFYSIDVPPAESAPGCGVEGAKVQFAINGIPAAPSVLFQPGARIVADLVAGEPFAAFSGKLALNGAPLPFQPDLPVLKAFIGGVECGSRNVSPGLVPETVTTVGSYTWLIVLSAGSRAGCGTEGAKTTFTLNGIAVKETATWSSGFHTLDLGAETATALPKLGGAPGATSANGLEIVAGLLLIAAGFGAIVVTRSRSLES